MDATRFDAIARLFASRRLSRRRALTTGGAGLAAGALATVGTGSAAANAEDAAPPDAAHGPAMLFVQSFRAGSVAPKEGAQGRYALTLEQGLGETVYFSDRPDLVVGSTPTPRFLAGLGFPADNPPNAALVAETAPGQTEIAVLQLYSPAYDEPTRTATYEVAVLQSWQRSAEEGFAEAPADLAAVAPSFGAAHLFIDDCPQTDINCWKSYDPSVGIIPNAEIGGICWTNVTGEGICVPCPYVHLGIWAALDYWGEECNARFAECNGVCQATLAA
jgi:hypothetical protein